MSKRNRKNAAPAQPSATGGNELDELLAGVEAPTAPDQGEVQTAIASILGADEGEVVQTTDDHADTDALLDALDDQNTQEAAAALVGSEPEGEEPLVGMENEPKIVVDKQAIYDAQESKITPAAPEDAAPVKKGRKKKGVAGEVTAAVAKAKLDPNASKSERLKSRANVEQLVDIGIAADDIEGIVAQLDSAPKKVSEKGANLIRFCLGREHLSGYTRFTLETLRDHGPMTVPDLVKRMQDRGWSIGTSRSQSQQMSRLFTIYGMIVKADGKIDLNREHPFVKTVLSKLKAQAKAAKKADAAQPAAAAA